MPLYIRSRKHGTPFDLSFAVQVGEGLEDLTPYQVGDLVVILLPLSAEQGQAIAALAHHEVRAVQEFLPVEEDWSVYLPLRVVERQHRLAWEQAGLLSPLGLSVTLECVSGLWEEVLCWVELGERPSWAPEEAQD
jgi:hypothetical protein